MNKKYLFSKSAWSIISNIGYKIVLSSRLKNINRNIKSNNRFTHEYAQTIQKPTRRF